LLECLCDLVVSIWLCSWASKPKYLIYFGLPISDKDNLDKITASCVWRSLERVSTDLGSLGKSFYSSQKMRSSWKQSSSRIRQQFKWLSSFILQVVFIIQVVSRLIWSINWYIFKLYIWIGIIQVMVTTRYITTYKWSSTLSDQFKSRKLPSLTRVQLD
jgi:hypothetical protein